MVDPPDDDDGRSVPFGQVILSYLALLVGYIAAEQALELTGVSEHRSALLVLGAISGSAALQRPRWVYQTVRNISWLAWLPPGLLRLILGVFAGTCLVGGLFVR